MRLIPIVLCCSIATAHAQRPQLFDRDSHFVQIDRHSAAPDRIRAICPVANPTDYAALIKAQDAYVDSVQHRNPSASAWLGLACRRALLFAMNSPGREGPLMPAGVSWASVTVDELTEALTLDPANLRAAQLLAVMAFEVIPAHNPAAEELPRLGPAKPADVAPAIVPRLANLIYHAILLDVTDPAVLRACTSLMIDAGDAGTAHDCSRRALSLGHDSTWHELRLTWLATLQRDTAAANALFLAALHSAHDPAARAELGWHFEDPCPSRDACSPYGVLDYRLSSDEKAAWLTLSDSAAARWFTARLALVAAGDTTRFWRGQYGMPVALMEPILRGSREWSALARRLAAHFTLVAYSGGTFRGCWATVMPYVPCYAMLSPYGGAPLQVVAHVDHLWNPATGSPIDLLPYTIIGNDLAVHDSAGERSAQVDLAYQRWGIAGARDTMRRLMLVIPPHSATHPAFTGYLVVPTVIGLDAWSLMATQAESRHGGVYQDSKAPLDTGPLALSDLVLGVASQGLSWESAGRKVVLAPMDVVLRNEPVQLYYQVKSDTDRARAHTRIVIFADGADRTKATPALQVEFDTPLRAGINEVDRELSLARLNAGGYWFEIEITDSATHAASRRSVMIFLT